MIVRDNELHWILDENRTSLFFTNYPLMRIAANIAINKIGVDQINISKLIFNTTGLTDTQDTTKPLVASVVRNLPNTTSFTFNQNVGDVVASHIISPNVLGDPTGQVFKNNTVLSFEDGEWIQPANKPIFVWGMGDGTQTISLYLTIAIGFKFLS